MAGMLINVRIPFYGDKTSSSLIWKELGFNSPISHSFRLDEVTFTIMKVESEWIREWIETNLLLEDNLGWVMGLNDLKDLLRDLEDFTYYIRAPEWVEVAIHQISSIINTFSETDVEFEAFYR